MWLNHRSCRQVFRHQLRTSTIYRENLSFPVDPARRKWDHLKKTANFRQVLKRCWNLSDTWFCESNFHYSQCEWCYKLSEAFFRPSHWTWKFPPIWTSVRRCLCKSGSTCLGIRRPTFKDFFSLRTTTAPSPPTSSTAWARLPLYLPGETVPLHRKVRKMLFSLLMTLAEWDIWDHPPQVVTCIREWVERRSQELLPGWDTTGPGSPNSAWPWVCYPCCKQAAPQTMCPPSPPCQATASHGFEAWGWSHAEQSLLVFNSIPKYLNSFQVMC